MVPELASRLLPASPIFTPIALAPAPYAPARIRPSLSTCAPLAARTQAPIALVLLVRADAARISPLLTRLASPYMPLTRAPVGLAASASVMALIEPLLVMLAESAPNAAAA